MTQSPPRIQPPTPATGSPTTVEHAGFLEDLDTMPAYLAPGHLEGVGQTGKISCSYCGVGDGGTFTSDSTTDTPELGVTPGSGFFQVVIDGESKRLPASLDSTGLLSVRTPGSISNRSGVVSGSLEIGGQTASFRGVETERRCEGDDGIQTFSYAKNALKVTRFKITGCAPTGGCVKLRLSAMRQRTAFPIHIEPSILDPATGKRVAISYEMAISVYADLLLKHRAKGHRTLLYGSGQLDIFSIFAMQEVFRLLGIRNLTGNAEHCLNAGAVHNEILTGQEGPFLTIDQAVEGPGRIYLFNGWNGMLTHPPVYQAMTKRKDFDAFVIEVMVTETAKGVAQKLGAEHILLIRPKGDPHLALAVAHELFLNYADRIDARFVERFSDRDSFERFKACATSAIFAPDLVAERLAPEPGYEDRLRKGIRKIAARFAEPDSVPINMPSVGLSQTSGVVAHCLWGSVLAMLGKFGLHPDGSVLGGVLRVPGQINAESEVQGLSRKYGYGRVPWENVDDITGRMGLPDGAYQRVLDDKARAALDYSEPTPDEHELFMCFGTQFEANMMNRRRFLEKLLHANNTLVVIDPIPDPWSEKHAALIIPSPPHSATTKLYQNGEWKLTLSTPQKRAAPETRSDATIVYDVMAEIQRRLLGDEQLAEEHSDLMAHVKSGYLQARFGHRSSPDGDAGAPGLTRIDGEVSRVELFARLQDYLHGTKSGAGPLYCAFDHADGTPIVWDELVERGSVWYGGVGKTRFVLDYDDLGCVPFKDIYNNPGSFTFFVPTDDDLKMPQGVILNSGRSSLSDDRSRVQFATSSFNSGKATPVSNMPDFHPVYVSPGLAKQKGLRTGDYARVTNRESGHTITMNVAISDRVKGQSLYASFHRSGEQLGRGLYLNDVTHHVDRCAYSGQSSLKASLVSIEKVAALEGADSLSTEAADQQSASSTGVDLTGLTTYEELPVWTGEDMPLVLVDVFKETHNFLTYRFQTDPVSRFVYKPGQFVSLVLEIDGKRVIRSYSISSTPTRPYTLEISVKRVPDGLVSNWLADHLSVGDSVIARAPSGKFHLEPGAIPEKILFLSGGSGVTPVMSMARWLCDISADVDVKFFNSIRTSADFAYRREIETMAQRYRQFTPCVVTSTRGDDDEWTGLCGRIDKHMLRMIAPDLHERTIYMCGPPGFMEAVKTILAEVEFPLSQLKMESFGGTRSPGIPVVPAGGDTAKSVEVTFARSGKRVTAPGEMSLLEIAEENGVDFDYGCRSGSCGDCRLRVITGTVGADIDDGLEEDEIKDGYVLACVARAQGNCTVDA